MDIIVEGKASQFFKPDLVNIDISFYTKSSTYEKTLSEGTTNVEDFIFNILNALEFSKEDLKTRAFRVSEVTKYDEFKKKHVPDGFSYTQNAKLSFDYDMERLSKFMELVSKLKNPPTYRLSFNIKNEEVAKAKVISKAFEKAETKANIIAMAAGKSLKQCVKVDFKPFNERVISNSNLDNNFLMAEKCMSRSVSDVMQNIFTPEDVEITESLHCLWLAE